MADQPGDTVVDVEFASDDGRLRYTRSGDGRFEIECTLQIGGIQAEIENDSPAAQVERVIADVQMTALSELLRLTLGLLPQLPDPRPQPLPPIAAPTPDAGTPPSEGTAEWDGSALTVRPQLLVTRMAATCPGASDATMLQWLALSVMEANRTSLRDEFGQSLRSAVGGTARSSAEE